MPSGDRQGEAAPSEGLDTRAMRGALEARLFGDAVEPTTVGRFEILNSLGRGGMGVVYAAHDPQLDRRVALKLLHNDRGQPSAPSEDLLAEARALARLNHRNVVTIYETGVHDGALFLAMEFLEGGTMAAWTRDHPVRTRSNAKAAVRLYLQAGAGLAAAHDAGLVHRDFKPANVLLGDGGRPAVADFGLARGSSLSVEDLATFDDGSTAERMTTATIVGTPAYMSPEQFDGVVDARSDQFSFCVSLWEALFGARPFEGDTPTALRVRMHDGAPPRAPSAAPVPRGVERALRRGLALDPADRWPTMAPLLAALAHDPVAHVRTGALVLASAGAVGIAAWQPWESELSPCDGAGDALEDVWGAERRTQVSLALTGSGGGFGLQTQQRVERALDDYASGWHAVRREACEASLVRSERSAEAYDLTMQCLNGRRDELGTVTSILAAGDVSVAERAVAAAAALSPLEPCSDLESLRGEALDDPARATELEALKQERIRIRALLDTGQHAAAIEAAPAAVEAARKADDARGLARALELLGASMRATDRFEEAKQVFEEALRTAATVGDDALAARVWPRLITVVGQHLNDSKPIETWRLAAETVVLRAGGKPEDQAALHHALGNVARRAKSFDDAEREHLAGLAIRQEHMADNALEIADSLNRLAGVYFDRRDLPKAESIMHEVLTTFTEALGADHPRVATITYNLAGILAMEGKYDDAIATYGDALRIYQDVYGPRSPKMGATLNNLAAALGRAGRYEEAIEKSELALAIVSEHRGADSPTLAPMYNNLGASYDAAGRLEDSLAAHVKAIELVEGEGDTASLGINLSNLGLMQAALDQPEAALKSYLRSIDVYEKALGPDHPDLWRPLAMLARLHRKQGEIAKALPLAERAVAVLEGHDLQPMEVADARFELARIRRLSGINDARTIELAKSAQRLWLTSDGAKEASVIGEWLTEARHAP